MLVGLGGTRAVGEGRDGGCVGREGGGGEGGGERDHVHGGGRDHVFPVGYPEERGVCVCVVRIGKSRHMFENYRIITCAN